MSLPRPAHETKHKPTLEYPHLGHTFHLIQHDDGHSNGTALWLSAQILSLYLTYHLKPPTGRRSRAVELGSGVGLTALVLSTLGYDVLATDIPHVCNSVLRHNMTANLPHLPATAGVIQVRELDWTVESDKWLWNDPMRITPNGDASTNDTLYDVSLVHPFFRTVRTLATSSRETDPLFLLAFERRDPELIEGALGCAPVLLSRVATKKVRKVMVRAGIRWDVSDWEGVEIWKGNVRDTHT